MKIINGISEELEKLGIPSQEAKKIQEWYLKSGISILNYFDKPPTVEQQVKAILQLWEDSQEKFPRSPKNT